MQEVWQRTHGLQSPNTSSSPSQADAPGSPAVAALGPHQVAATQAGTSVERPKTRATTDLRESDYIVNLVFLCAVFLFAVTSAAVLSDGTSAPTVADHDLSSMSGARRRCFVNMRGPHLQWSSAGTGSLAVQIEQRTAAHSGRCPEELPQFIERPCDPGWAQAQGDEPETHAWVTVGFSVACVLAMCTLARVNCLPIQGLGTLLAPLQGDPSRAVDVLTSLSTDAPSSIKEACALQKAVGLLMRTMDASGRVPPPSGVRKITVGDDRISRPRAEHHPVTIMFSDVQNLTKLCEALPVHDVIYVLNRYISGMAQASEMYEGTVSEVQGDGLLVFWNYPTSVEDHMAKACKAALASQYTLTLINRHFAGLGLPQLVMRIGLHSGLALSGVLGSKSRKKFGCMGDSVNLAIRLEGLCTRYGVGAVCSEAVHRSLPPGSDFLLRRLDRVRPGGRREAAAVYELLRAEEHAEAPARHRLLRERAGLYEQALDAYLAGHPVRARELAARVQRADPEDLAAGLLLKRIASCFDERGHVCLGQAKREDWTGVLALDSY